MKWTTDRTLAVALILCAPAFLQAQEPEAHEHEHAQMMAEHCPMAGAPAMVLMVQDELNLTEQQISTIEALHGETQRTQQGIMERMQEVHRQAAAVAEADAFDANAAGAVAQEAGQLHAELMMAMLHARHQTTHALEPAQRQQLQELHRGHHEAGHRHGMGMMMMDCPMMTDHMHHDDAHRRH